MKKVLLLLALPLALSACQGKCCSAAATASDSTTTTATTPAPPLPADVKIATLSLNAKGEALLQEIIAAHKGAPIVIDIWATWCGPCTRAMVEMEEIKPKLKEKGVAFVYLTDESSPEGEWQERIATLPGTHYRISGEQMANFGIVGYPSFVVVDKDGKIVLDTRATAGFPGNAAIVEALGVQ